MLSKRPGETFDPVTATLIGWNASRGFKSELLGERAQRLLDRLGRERLDLGERPLGLLEHTPVEQRRVGVDLAEEEAGELRIFGQLRDLLLDERDRRAQELLVPVIALLAEVAREPVRVCIGSQRSQVDAVQPFELLEVEDCRARADPVEGEPLDELLARHDGRLVVVAPAQKCEEVDERLREVALGTELLGGDCAVALRQLLPVGAEDVAPGARTRERDAERTEDLDLLRRVRDVIVAAQDVRDPVQPVFDRRGEVVGRPSVGAEDDEVLDLLVRVLDATRG